MQKVLLELNQNILLLGEQLSEFIGQLFDARVRSMADKFVARMSRFFVELADAVEKFKIGRITEIILEFLVDVENFLTSIYSKFDLPLDKLMDMTRELVQLIRLQVIYLDQKRQSYFAF